MTGPDFFGGIELSYHKELSAAEPIKEIAVPEKAVIPLRQNIGAVCETLVQAGDRVEAGQKIGESKETLSAPVYTSFSGKVEEIKPYPSIAGKKIESIIISVDEEQSKDFSITKNKLEQVSAKEINELVKEAGIVGMGGAGFPTPVKLSPPPDKKVETIIINGCECEPYLTCDYRVMVENSDKIIKGIKIMLKKLKARSCIIAVEDNKEKAIQNLKKANEDAKITVKSLPTRYPQGSEKMLTSALLDREVPSGGLPLDIGVVVQNIQTVTSIYDAVILEKPLLDRVVTITGQSLGKPANVVVKVGTPIEHIINQCGGIKDDNYRVVMGGPMMGTAVSSLQIPIVKTSTGIVILSADKIADYSNYRNCIRCEKCIDACPIKLYPNFLSICCEEERLKEAYEQWDIMDCIECGICSYVCVSKRPIAQFIKKAKPGIKAMVRNGEIGEGCND